MKLIHYSIYNILLKLMIVVLTIFFFISSYFIIHDFFEYKENNHENEELMEIAITNSNKETEEKILDWNYLKNINEDIIGWIEIENTTINYPILKDNESLYYLKHSFNKKYNSNGSIFILDSSLFTNKETIIYGHNMKNGSMFSDLSNYLNQEFLYSHQIINIYTPNGNYEGKVFSAYSIDLENENVRIKNLDHKERIEYYKNTSKVKVENIEMTDEILKLCTCSYINVRTRPTNQRYFIIATLHKI